jgi:hypothetical protein
MIIRFFSSILNKIKKFLKIIKFVIFKIPKRFVKIIIISFINIFKGFKLLFHKKNKIKEKQKDEEIVLAYEKENETTIIQKDLFMLNENIKMQNKLLEKIIINLNLLEKQNNKKQKNKKGYQK